MLTAASSQQLMRDPMEYWYHYQGRHIQHALPETITETVTCGKCSRTLKGYRKPKYDICYQCNIMHQAYPMGSKPSSTMRMGGKDSLIFCRDGGSVIMADVTLNAPSVQVATDCQTVAIKRWIADFYATDAKAPYFLAILGRKDRFDTFRVTVSDSIGHLCGDEPLRIDVSRYRSAWSVVNSIEPRVWRSTVDTYQREEYQKNSTSGKQQQAMQQHFDTHPALREIMPDFPLIGSDEFTLLTWSYLNGTPA